MKKILISSYDLNYGGIETSLINLLKNFNLEKYKVTLVLEKKQGVYLKDVPKGIRIKEYRVSENKNKIIRKFINLLKRLKWIIGNYKRYSVSICYATYSKPCSFVARTASSNRILYIHSNYLNVYNKDIDTITNFFNERKILSYSKIIFVSNESRKDLISIYPNIEKNSYVINNFIDQDSILKKADKKISINTDKKIVLFVGRLEERAKKISRIIEVANKMKKDNVEFWIVGDGENKNDYKKMISDYKLDNVKLLGAKSNPYPYIKMCDIMILTSDYEGFPVVYNEAIVLNKPILSTVDVSDDIISIPNRFGIITKKDTNSIYKDLKSMLRKKYVIKEKVNFNDINKRRLIALERLLESKNDKV